VSDGQERPLGEVTYLDVAPPGDHDEEWEVTWWRSIVFPNVEGEIHHGSRGARMPDAVIVRTDGAEVALADAYAHVLDNQYCLDTEYFLVLRLREVVDAQRWASLPWAHLGPGEVFYAWDKFHGHEYSRAPGDATVMSYGGDWADLQFYIDREHPRPGSAGLPAAPASPASLLRAVRDGDVDQLRALLEAGADPDAGLDVRFEATRSVSWDRDSSALWEAVMAGSPEMVEALLAAGASVDGRHRSEWMTPLHGALAQRRFEVVPLLLRAGADPEAPYQGRTARAVAAELGPEVAALFDEVGERR
jgi:hypothetical protein